MEFKETKKQNKKIQELIIGVSIFVFKKNADDQP